MSGGVKGNAASLLCVVQHNNLCDTGVTEGTVTDNSQDVSDTRSFK